VLFVSEFSDRRTLEFQKDYIPQGLTRGRGGGSLVVIHLSLLVEDAAAAASDDMMVLHSKC